MCHLAQVYGYMLVEHSVLIYEDTRCAYLDEVLVGDSLKS